MNSHIDLGQPNITKINVNTQADNHLKEKLIKSEKQSSREIRQPDVIADKGEVVMPSISVASPKSKNAILQMSDILM
jgi:hypothetical protein